MSAIAEPELELAERAAPAGRRAAPPIDPPEPAASEPKKRAKPKRTYYQSLDLWRGVACLMLVLFHCTFYAAGEWRTLDPSTWSLGSFALNLLTRLWIGVPMFFVVSGYCIAASVDSLRKRPHSLASFFYRRIRRIYPPLWAALALAVGFILVINFWPAAAARCVQLPQLAELSAWDWIGNLTASESWLSTAAGSDPHYLMKNTWTLCYEEQFYLLTGLILLLAARRFFRAAAAITAVVFLARPARPALSALGIPVAGFFFDGHWLMFALGLLVYQHIKYGHRRSGWVTWAVLGLGLVYGLALRVLCKEHADRHLGEYIAVASGFAMLLIWLKPWDREVASHWLVQPINWCGKISYSIYLTHFPIVVFLASVLAAWGIHSDGLVVLVTVPLALAITLPLAWLFYHAVERHFINSPSNA